MSPTVDKKTIIVTGAAGFIGSQLIDRLLDLGFAVIGIDNFVRGLRQNLTSAFQNNAFQFIELDLCDEGKLSATLSKLCGSQKVEAIWHMAANSDIPAGVTNPDVDFRDTFLTTFNILKMAKKFQVEQFYFASSSAIYGEHSDALEESTGPCFPLSNYGAMKLASEGSLSAATESFLQRSWIFRFPNVVGPRATHGVIYDFMHRLKKDPSHLNVLGDGNQQKPYLHVSELLDAMLHAKKFAKEKLNCFNIGVERSGTTVKFIAENVVKVAAPQARISYQGGRQGWVGDVPKFSFSTAKIRALGWQPKIASDAAILQAINEVHQEVFYAQE